MPTPIVELFNAGQVVTQNDDDSQTPYVVLKDASGDDIHIAPLGGENVDRATWVPAADCTAQTLAWLKDALPDS